MGLSSKVLLLAVSLAVGVSPGAHAYPIAPVPLWSLVQESETIVLAKVVKVEETTSDPGIKDDGTFEWPLSVATLHILETWKGPAVGEIEVKFVAGLICPAPPRYVEDEDVVAFLSKEDEGWGTTVGLSYGTLYPESREELEDLRVMVRRAIMLQSKGRVRKADRIDWLVEAAVRPGTRWHGLYELDPEGDELHSFYDPGRSKRSRRLSLERRERIAHAFATRPWADHTLPMALRLLAGYPDRQVDEASASAIEGLLSQEQLPYWTPESLKLVLERYGDRKAAKKIEALKKDCCDYDEDGIRTLWRTAQRDLGIPKVVPLKIVKREVRGVGAETPD